MKTTLPLLLSAGLASAQVNLANQVGVNDLNSSGIGNGFSAANFDLGNLDLGSLEVGGLNLGNVDLGNQDVVAEAILAMLGGFCLGNALDLNSILGFGFNNDVDLFFQLAQLMQFEQLGFLNLGRIHSLFNKGLALGRFNLGVFKREISEARKTMKRTKLRRGQKVKRQCATISGGSGIATATEGAAFTIATADPNAFATSAAVVAGADTGFTIATAANPDSVATSSASVASISVASTVNAAVAAASATSSPVAAAAVATASVAAAATTAAASTSVSPVAAATATQVVQVAASVAPAAAQVAPSVIPAADQAVPSVAPAAGQVVASAVPAAADASSAPASAAVAISQPTAATENVDNLSDLTR